MDLKTNAENLSGYEIQKEVVKPQFVLTDKLKKQCEADVRKKLSPPCEHAKSHFIQGCKYLAIIVKDDSIVVFRKRF